MEEKVGGRGRIEGIADVTLGRLGSTLRSTGKRRNGFLQVFDLTRYTPMTR